MPQVFFQFFIFPRTTVSLSSRLKAQKRLLCRFCKTTIFSVNIFTVLLQRVSWPCRLSQAKCVPRQRKRTTTPVATRSVQGHVKYNAFTDDLTRGNAASRRKESVASLCRAVQCKTCGGGRPPPSCIFNLCAGYMKACIRRYPIILPYIFFQDTVALQALPYTAAGHRPPLHQRVA